MFLEPHEFLEPRNQDQVVVNFMLEHGSIHPMQAIHDLGITRLAACIHRLRKEYYIDSEEIVVNNPRYGDPTSVAKYRFMTDKEIEAIKNRKLLPWMDDLFPEEFFKGGDK